MGMTRDGKSVDLYPAGTTVGSTDGVGVPTAHGSLRIWTCDWLPHCEAVKSEAPLPLSSLSTLSQTGSCSWRCARVVARHAYTHRGKKTRCANMCTEHKRVHEPSQKKTTEIQQLPNTLRTLFGWFRFVFATMSFLHFQPWIGSILTKTRPKINIHWLSL